MNAARTKLKIVFLLGLFLPSPLFAEGIEQLWPVALSSLQKRLRDDHISESQLKLLDPAKLKFGAAAVRLKLLDKIANAPDPEQFITTKSLQRARKFLSDHRKVLAETFNETCVPPSITVAVLSVETSLGRFKPQFPVLATLASHATLGNEGLREALIPSLLEHARRNPRQYQGMGLIDWRARAKEIGEKWYLQLRSYFLLADQLKWSERTILAMRGSFTGAIGYSQWQPERAEARMKDQRFDLWSWNDSIWHTSAELAGNDFESDPEKALKKYNDVRWYREAVFRIAGELGSTGTGHARPASNQTMVTEAHPTERPARCGVPTAVPSPAQSREVSAGSQPNSNDRSRGIELKPSLQTGPRKSPGRDRE
ncbi:MAG: lytic murein transglycosylase [Pseudomonadota bacterium]